MSKKRILIAHGWLHSAKRYESLKKELERRGNCEVTLYEFSGFGQTPARYRRGILKHYVAEMEELLRREPFDAVIGHSMGGSVLLKAAVSCDYPGTLFLLNPEYAGVPLLKVLTPLTPALFIFLYLAKLPRRLTEPFIRLMALFTVNRYDKVDGRLIEDVRRADPWTAAVLFAELAWDPWRVPEITAEGMPKEEESAQTGRRLGKRTVLLISEKDRLLPARHMWELKQELGVGCSRVFRGIGHTIVLEDFEELVNVLAKKIKLPPREISKEEISLQADRERREEQ